LILINKETICRQFIDIKIFAPGTDAGLPDQTPKPVLMFLLTGKAGTGWVMPGRSIADRQPAMQAMLPGAAKQYL
jgi:hypothetical protein